MPSGSKRSTSAVKSASRGYAGADRLGRHRRELAPVRSRLERREGRLEDRQHLADARASPACQVKWSATDVAADGRAHPEVVGRDRPDLRDLQERARSGRAAPSTASSASTAWRARASGTRSAARRRRSGVWSIRKCGSRSCHGPGTPSCSVHASAGIRRIGWIGTVARVAPKSVGGGSNVAVRLDPSLEPDLLEDRAAPVGEQADAVGERGDLVEVVDDRAQRAGPRRGPGASGTSARGRSVSRVTTPSAPSPTTAPANVSGSPSADERDDLPVGRSPAPWPSTAVARLPLPSPEPWVAVAHAPATEMCGSEARLCSANPAASSGPHSSP